MAPYQASADRNAKREEPSSVVTTAKINRMTSREGSNSAVAKQYQMTTGWPTNHVFKEHSKEICLMVRLVVTTQLSMADRCLSYVCCSCSADLIQQEKFWNNADLARP